MGFIVHIDGRTGIPAVTHIHGTNHATEISQHTHDGVGLVVLGHCLYSAARRSAEFVAALQASDLDSVAQWPGSYSVVALRPGSIVTYSDLAGQFPLYYSALNGEILVGSEPSLLAIKHHRKLDPVTAAVNICCPAVLPLWSARSPYSGIERLAGGAVLRADANSLRIDPGQPPLPVTGRTLSDGADLLRSALVAGIRARCEGHTVSSDFSGGLDSTSIAFVAAESSQKLVKSIAYYQPLAPATDLADAMRFAALNPLIDLAVARGSARSLPFAGLAAAMRAGEPLSAAVPWSAEPSQGALIADRSTLRLAAASSSGAGLHLTGEGGDAVLMAAPSYLGGLARPRLAHTLFRHCGAYARLRYVSPARLAARAIMRARARPERALRALAMELENPVSRPPDWADLIGWWPPCGEAATWLTRRIRRQLAEIAADPATARAVPVGAAPADLAALADLRRSGDAQRQLREVARPFGLAVHAPFLDSAVIRAALSVPATERAHPWSYKPLLRSALAGLVPAEVFGRRTKGDYSAEDYRGALGASDALQALLRDSRLAALGVIEPRAVAAVFQRMAAGVAVPLGPVNMLIATESWLRIADDVRAGEPVRC
jgi:asparagine synthase (glutamine-hydrolysing)